MNNKTPMILSVSTMEDIERLKKLPNVKYINIDITNPNLEVIYYFIENGQNYSYSEMIDGINGYIYVSYDIFKKSELDILDIVNNANPSFSPIELSKYLYIQIGKKIGYDINVLKDKNETFNLSIINTLNNIWGSIYNNKGTNISLTKLYLYLCKLMKIDCKLITINKIGYLKNILNIDGSNIIVDITQDLPFIQSGFQTKHFLGYNDDIEMDKKIGFIKDNYSELLIQKALKKLDYTEDTFFKKILDKTQQIINPSEIKPIELGIIYDIIFSKYCPNYNISINNLFINISQEKKEHFILICFNEKYYSYNYTKESFVEISAKCLKENINKNKIGIYQNENVPLFYQNIKKVA